MKFRAWDIEEIANNIIALPFINEHTYETFLKSAGITKGTQQ